MPSDRTQARFDELCDIKRGASPRPIQEWMAPSGIPWVKISDATAAKSRFIDSTAEYIRSDGGRYSVAVHPGDFILSNSATPGLPKIMRINACIHDGWLLLRNFRRITKEYCYYLLLNERPKLVAQGNGSVFTNLKTEILKSHVVEVPTLTEQDRVSELLLSLDDRLDLLRQTNATLESIAQALFKSWFIDFDPVRAKAEGREPEGMDAATAALFPAEFEESALGLIPTGWRAGTLADAVHINPARSLSKGVEAKYLEMANAPTSGHRPLEPVEPRAFGSGCKFQNGDTLLAKITPCLENGKGAYVDFLDGNEVGWGSTEFIVLRSKTSMPLYASYLLSRYEPFRQFAIQAMTGTSGRQRVELSRLSQFQLAVPPSSAIAEASDATFTALQTRIAANSQKAATLALLRDTLLPRLISGKLRLPEASEQLGADLT